MKKFLSVLLCVVIGFSTISLTAFAANDAKLYQVYGSGMVFQHDEPITLAGTAQAGSQISFEIKNAAGEVIRTASAAAKADGSFAVTCENGINGGYDSYKIEAYCNNTLFATLEDVLFGIVWIASGQSNMQMGLGSSAVGAVMQEKGETGSEYLRFLKVPALVEYNGSSDNLALEPQIDIPGAYWIKGNTTGIYGVTGVGYFFAENLLEELDMPVAALDIPLGGSSIYTWISRDAIDSDPAVKADLKALNRYIEASDWSKTSKEHSNYATMTANYNKKIEALQFFNVDGMIWYQGESDVNCPYRYYSRAFDLMQRSYSDVFGYEDSLLPIVYTQIADYSYSGKSHIESAQLNMQFAEMQAKEPDTRATVSIYDVSLDYEEALGDIHPTNKKPIALKMAYAALGLVYDKYDTYTAPAFDSFYVENGSVYVKIKNVGDGLAVKNTTVYPECPLYGFSVCGENGIYVEADAEIVSKDTVRVYSASVPSPVNAAYAFTEQNTYSNLYSTVDGKILFGVSSFTTKLSSDAHYWQPTVWGNCDNNKVWHLGKASGFYDAWEVDSGDATLSYNSNDKVKGTASLQVESKSEKFTISPTMSFTVKPFDYRKHNDMQRDYSNYGTLSFKVKNTGKSDIALESVRFYENVISWHSPTVGSSEFVSTVIPADGKWYTITLDLNHLYFYSRDKGFVRNNDVLKYITDIELLFSGNNAQLLLDDFVFTAEEETETPIEFADFGDCFHTIYTFFSCAFKVFFENFVALFK